MVSFTFLLSAVSVVSLATTSLCTPTFPFPRGGQCGKVDVFFTGLPPNHPAVIAQGYDPAMVAAALAADKINILKAGYNLRTILIGPEQPISVVQKEMRSTVWEATGCGFGVRGSPALNMTIHFEDLIETFRERAPLSYIIFNHSPNSTLEALQRRVPIKGDCTNTPGQDLGTKVYCDICV